MTTDNVTHLPLPALEGIVEERPQGMAAQVAAISPLLARLDALEDAKVVGFSTNTYDPVAPYTLQARDRDTLDRIAATLLDTVESQRLYGEVMSPSVEVLGTWAGLPVRLFGPAANPPSRGV